MAAIVTITLPNPRTSPGHRARRRGAREVGLSEVSPVMAAAARSRCAQWAAALESTRGAHLDLGSRVLGSDLAHGSIRPAWSPGTNVSSPPGQPGTLDGAVRHASRAQAFEAAARLAPVTTAQRRARWHARVWYLPVGSACRRARAAREALKAPRERTTVPTALCRRPGAFLRRWAPGRGPNWNASTIAFTHPALARTGALLPVP